MQASSSVIEILYISLYHFFSIAQFLKDYSKKERIIIQLKIAILEELYWWFDNYYMSRDYEKFS